MIKKRQTKPPHAPTEAIIESTGETYAQLKVDREVL